MNRIAVCTTICVAASLVIIGSRLWPLGQTNRAPVFFSPLMAVRTIWQPCRMDQQGKSPKQLNGRKSRRSWRRLDLL